MERRKNLRLQGYDYSQNGVYFVTACTENRVKWLWSHPVGERSALPPVPQPLSEYGHVVEYAIQQIPIRYPTISVDKYVIMPNHIHLLIRVANQDGSAVRSPTMSRLMNQLKGYVTKRIGKSIWQESFYDHVIRDEADYLIKWNYIDENPLRWVEDKYYI